MAWKLAAAFLACLACAAPSVGPAAPTDRAAGPLTARDWATIGQLPDWSGTWVPDMHDQAAQVTSNPPPWTPAAAAYVAHQIDEEKAGRPVGLFINCLPEGMPAWMLISHNAMEFAFTPGRVLMLGESEGNRLRRIYTDGRGHADDPDPSFHGDSVGHWEGDTLVIDTIGVLPETFLAVSESVGVPNNGDMHVVERMHLAGPDVLHDDIEITAPHVLTGPWKTTRIYTRQRGPHSNIVEGECLQGSFSEKVDKDGNAVFEAVKQDNGNVIPGGK